MDNERGVRVRLIFQEPKILSRQQIAEGLEQCWFLVISASANRISDIATDISHAFELNASCPNGVVLEVEGFVLPPSQPAQLLKESDLVRIYRRKDQQFLHIAQDNGKDLREVINRYRFTGYDGELDDFEEPRQDQFEVEDGENNVTSNGRLKETDLAKSLPSPLGEIVQDGRKGVGKSRRKRDVESAPDLVLAEVQDIPNKVSDFNMQIDPGVCASGKVKKKKRAFVEEECEREAITRTELPNGDRKLEKIDKKRKKSKNVNLELTCAKGESSPAVSFSSDGKLEEIEMRHKKPKISKLERSSGKGATSQAVYLGSDINLELKKRRDKKSKNVNSESQENFEDVSKKVSKASRNLKSLNGSSMHEIEAVEEKISRKGKAASDVAITKTPKNSALTKLAENQSPVCSMDDSPLFRLPDEKGEKGLGDQRPSRSARRKKAKRLWLREQAKNCLLPFTSRSSESHGSKLQKWKKNLEAISTKNEVLEGEVEAEEEVLPVMIGSGHIRFLSYEENEAAEQPAASSPLWFGDLPKSKRQGQNWGQGKSAERKSTGIRWTTDSNNAESPEVEDQCQAVLTNFETFPLLEGLPKAGDVLAYRLVELTSSWTPELSPYRVGVVIQLDHGTMTVKLDPHPDYPLFESGDTLEDENADWVNESEPMAPYDESGSLQTEVSALVELRLVQRKNLDLEELAPSQVQIAGEGEPSVLSSHKDNDLLPKLVSPESVSEVASLRSSVLGNKDADVGKTAPRWQDLALELEQKKLEISQKEFKIVCQSPNQALKHALGPEVSGNGAKELESGRSGHEEGILKERIHEGRKSKYLRIAGVGSIVAMLRSQQGL